MSAHDGLDQRAIWRHFHEDPAAFADAEPRLRFLAKQVERRRAAPGVRVLNVGVGAGYLERLGLRAGWRVCSLDPDAIALSRLSLEGVSASAGFVQNLPFRSGSFDFVVVSEVLEHLDDAAGQEALAEIARVLGATGWILGTVPHAEDLASQRTVCPRCGLVFHRWGHQRSFDPRSLRRSLDEHFAVERISVRAFVDFGKRGGLGKLKGLGRLLLARLGEPVAVPTIYFAARAPGD